VAHSDVWIDGNKLLHVSAIAKIADDPSGLVTWAKNNTPKYCEEYLQFTQDRGNLIHNNIQALFEDRVSLLPKTKYIEWFKTILKWKNKVQYKPIKNEYRVTSKIHKFTGTFDSYGLINPPTIIDYKATSGIRLSHAVQPVGYIVALNEQDGIEVKHWRIVRLYELKTAAKKTTIIEQRRSFKYCFEGSKIFIEEMQFELNDFWLGLWNNCLGVAKARKEW